MIVLKIMSDFFNKIKEYLLAFFGLLAAIFATLFFWEKSKESTSEALLKNNEVKNQLNDLDQQIAKNQGLINAEQQAVKDKETNETNDSILNDLNSRK